jgi:hypothetical protein
MRDVKLCVLALLVQRVCENRAHRTWVQIHLRRRSILPA